jgi:hypothetical protein
VKFASPLQNIRLTAEENEVIKKSASLLNEAYTRKKQQESPGPTHDLPDSDKVGPTAPQPAFIPFTLIIVALGIFGAIAISQKRRSEL